MSKKQSVRSNAEVADYCSSYTAR